MKIDARSASSSAVASQKDHGYLYSSSFWVGSLPRCALTDIHIFLLMLPGHMSMMGSRGIIYDDV